MNREPNFGRRPADFFIPSWSHGAPAAFDLAVSSPQRQAALARNFREVGAAAALYEDTKRTHLNTADTCASQGLTFVPLVAEPSGGWGPTGAKTLRRLAKAVELRTGAPAGSVRAQLFQQLAVSIRRSSARAILRRATDDETLEQSSLQAARDLLSESMSVN